MAARLKQVQVGALEEETQATAERRNPDIWGDTSAVLRRLVMADIKEV